MLFLLVLMMGSEVLATCTSQASCDTCVANGCLWSVITGTAFGCCLDRKDKKSKFQNLPDKYHTACFSALSSNLNARNFVHNLDSFTKCDAAPWLTVHAPIGASGEAIKSKAFDETAFLQNNAVALKQAIDNKDCLGVLAIWEAQETGISDSLADIPAKGGKFGSSESELADKAGKANDIAGLVQGRLSPSDGNPLVGAGVGLAFTGLDLMVKVYAMHLQNNAEAQLKVGELLPSVQAFCQVEVPCKLGSAATRKMSIYTGSGSSTTGAAKKALDILEKQGMDASFYSMTSSGQLDVTCDTCGSIAPLSAGAKLNLYAELELACKALRNPNIAPLAVKKCFPDSVFAFRRALNLLSSVDAAALKKLQATNEWVDAKKCLGSSSRRRHHARKHQHRA